MIQKLKNKLNGDIHFKEILTGSAITFVLKMSGMLLGYVVILIISRQYGAEGVGVYNLTLSLMTFVAMIAAMGMNVSILRYVGQFNKSGEEHKLKLLYRYALELVVPFSLLLAFLLYTFSDYIALNIFNNPIYIPALEFAAILVPFIALENISVEFIRGLKQLKISEFLRSINRPLINITLLLVFSLYLVNQLLPIYTLGIGIFIGVIIAVNFIIKRMKNIQYAKYNDFSKKELFTTSMPMMVTSIASFLMGNISIFMLEIFSTTEEVGIFSVVTKIAALISLILIVVNTIAAPKFSELYWSNEYKKLQKVIYYSSKIIFLVSLLLGILIILFSVEILEMFGEEFIAGRYALLYLTIGQLINAMTGSVGIFLNMTGHQKEFRNILIIGSFFGIILNILLVPYFGIDGAAIANVCSLLLWNFLSIIYIKQNIKFYVFYIPFVKYIRNEK